MGIFGGEKGEKGEKYSKEEYERAEKQANADLRSYHAVGGGHAQRLYDVLIAIADKSQERVEKIYGKGQAESIALNKEYDHLLAQAKEALQAVADFEREKLGMHKEGAEDADADADADKK